MALQLWGFAIGADNRPAQKAFGEIPVFSAKAGKDAGKKLGDGLKSGLGPIGKIAAGISPALAPVVERVNKVSMGLGGVSGNAAMAGIAVGGIGLAAGLAVAGIVGLTHKAAALEKELRPFQEVGLLPVGAADSVRGADAALVSITKVGKAFAVVAASEMAPAVERVATDVVALGLYGLDAFEGVEKSAKNAAIFLASGFVKAIAAPITGLSELSGIAGDVLVKLGQEEVGFKLLSVQTAWNAKTTEIATTALDFYADSWTDAEVAGSDYMAKARQIIGIQAGLTSGVKGTKKAVDSISMSFDVLKNQLSILDSVAESARDVEAAFSEWASAYTSLDQIASDAAMALLTPQERITAELETQIAKTQELAIVSGDYAKAQQAESDLRAASVIALADLEIQEAQRVASARISIAQQILSGVESLAQAEIDAKGESAKAAVVIQKSAAILQIGISTAQAIAQALTLGPIVGTAAAFGIGAIGAIQAAKVAATPVPSYAVGFVPTSRAGEHAAYVGNDEAVLNRRGRMKLGDSVIRAANSGLSPSQNVSVQISGRDVTTAVVGDLRRNRRASDRLQRTGETGRMVWA